MTDICCTINMCTWVPCFQSFKNPVFNWNIEKLCEINYDCFEISVTVLKPSNEGETWKLYYWRARVLTSDAIKENL